MPKPHFRNWEVINRLLHCESDSVGWGESKSQALATSGCDFKRAER